jgi:hypothetical protein
LIEIAMTAAVTVSISGVSYAALNPEKLTAGTQVVADRATCRTVESAIVAFIAVNDAGPASVRQLKPFVVGDISRYRIVEGRAAGPGC